MTETSVAEVVRRLIHLHGIPAVLDCLSAQCVERAKQSRGGEPTSLMDERRKSYERAALKLAGIAIDLSVHT